MQHLIICTPQTLIVIVKSERMKGAWNTASLGEVRKAYKILVGKPKGKLLPETCKSR
jgi:hypothetical protein